MFRTPKRVHSKPRKTREQAAGRHYARFERLPSRYRLASPLADEGQACLVPLHTSLKANLDLLAELLRDCEDVVYRRLCLSNFRDREAAVVYVDGLVDNFTVDTQIVKVLLLESASVSPFSTQALAEDVLSLFQRIKDSLITVGQVREIGDLREAAACLFRGFALLFLDGVGKALALEVCGWEHRGIEESPAESLIRGPRESFTECLRTNTALLRRRIRDPELKYRTFFLGRRTRTPVGMMYLAGVANPGLVEEVERRLQSIDIDGVLESAFIEQLIEDKWYSPFSQIQNTERPDEACAALLEGRVVVLTDNTPFALIIPATFNNLLHTPEDFYHRWFITVLVRLLRFLGSIIALILPSMYISMVSFSPEMIPTSLAISIGAGREGLPFPTVIEAFIMETTLELMREAGIRLPSPLGQTLGVVGAIILGQAAVQAGIVSSAMVIVVSLTGIAGFVTPSYDAAIALRILRFFLMIMAAVLGLYGVILGLMLILTHLVSLKSFGVPYLKPWAPWTFRDLKDSVYRAPLFRQRTRPAYLHPLEEERLG